MGKVPQRKRLSHKKKRPRSCGKSTNKSRSQTVSSVEHASCSKAGDKSNDTPSTSCKLFASQETLCSSATSPQIQSELSNVVSAVDHDYFSKPDSVEGNIENHLDAEIEIPVFSPELREVPISPNSVEVVHQEVLIEEIDISSECVPEVSVSDLFIEVKKKLDLLLPRRWTVFVKRDSLEAVYVSAGRSTSIQRSLLVSGQGVIDLYVHCHLVPSDPYVPKDSPAIPLSFDSVNYFVDRIATTVNNVRVMEICSGYDEEKFQVAWSSCTLGQIDHNPYQECRYVETFRSASCLRLVKGRQWRCSECQKLYRPLRRGATKLAADHQPHINTPNHLLTKEQKLNKLQQQRGMLDNANRKILRLKTAMEKVISKKNVVVESAVADDLSDILRDTELTPAQSIFLQQQVKASQQKNMVGMRWHPTMIRFALSIYITSPAAYRLLQQTGMVKLPSSRTLFDYSHVCPAEEGIDRLVLDSLAGKISKFTGERERHKKYHVLMADEMHISENLIFQKSTGRLLGYTSLDDVEQEVNDLNQYLDNPNEEVKETIASKVLVYLVKGVSNGLKAVVCTYGVGTLTANQLYVWTWEVIGALERSGIAVIAFVSDGFSVNRSFIKKHKPATPHPSGVIFDTWNKAAKRRKIYFISDVPHLLKTIRNCLLNSRWDKRRSRRKMMKNGKKISWDFILKLYTSKMKFILRKSYKLNAMNVFPDSYARMKVRYAAQVLSKTVANDLRSQGWDDALETAHFIELVDQWFDCLNGAHSNQAKRTRNANLAAYSSPTDPRFGFLKEFLQYLDEWKSEAEGTNMSVNNITIASDLSMNADPVVEQDSVIDEGGVCEDENATPASIRMLSKQTIEGVQITTLAFEPMVKFLLGEGVQFLNARIFCQDPLEQHFSKLRAGQGGSTNPNLNQVLNRNRALHTIGELGMKQRRGNCGEDSTRVVVTTDPLPRRKSVRRPKFL